ncbi:PH domain-containing protein [Microbacterium sp. zg.Y625]|uniref:PH domain-containing protein n=1 Tax=Microbacterium jiangjiandongii TaxID=3049071 RepID=UPI00214C38DF|nr:MULTISPECIES: PH domain-containing protein [unclassified Microbacterium]MCR2793137.1 PH domain-containing protein [Microbacterium sp. zg.Y625]WIM24245.1 PH domain-containing protein [Microbacterium sp. zg-Y625]
MTQPGGVDRRVYRSGSGTVALIVAAAMTVFLLGDAVVRAGFAQMLVLAPSVLLVDWIIFAALFSPVVKTDAQGITVVNPIRRAEVPWGRVRDITTRWQLTLHLDDGSTVAAFGGPNVRPPRPRRGGALDAESDVPAYSDIELIRREWEDAAGRGSAAGPVQRGWNLPVVLSLAGLILWGLLALMVGGISA